MSSSVQDTSPAARDHLRALIAALTPAERLQRALALSSMARDFALAGARKFAGAEGADAVRTRFLEQQYGAEVAAWVSSRLAATGR